MKYNVIWLPDAEHELAAIWLNTTDRNAITIISNYMDRFLEQEPLQIGESRYGDIRILLINPLGITYRVILDDHRVEVIHIWKY